MPLKRRGSQARRSPTRRAPLPPDMSPAAARFEALVASALDELPDRVRGLLDNVAIVIDDESDESLYGLYEGVPMTEWGADYAPVPNKITLFRISLEADFADPTELAAEVRRTVLHELAHHAGFDDPRLSELDLD